MLKELLFCQFLYKRKKIKYKFTKTDRIVCDLFSINPWIKLIYKYTKNTYESYSVSNMLKEYASRNIDINKNKEKYKIYNDISIFNKESINNLQNNIYISDYIKEIQKYKSEENIEQNYLKNRIIADDNIYNNSDIWFLFYNNNIISIFLTLYSNKGTFILNGASKKPNIYLYMSLVFTKFLIGCTDNKIIYSIYPFVSSNIIPSNFNISGVKSFKKINKNFYSVEYSKEFFNNISKKEIEKITKRIRR